MTATTERAILAGGCFWGVQDLCACIPASFPPGWGIPGATSRTRPTVITVRMPRRSKSFDPKVMSLSAAAGVFFQIHDPTTLNRQGNDRGLSYRSAIYYTSEKQKESPRTPSRTSMLPACGPAKSSRKSPRPVDFWEAEPEHQDYLERIPDGYTCHFVRPQWKLPVRAKTAAGAA